MAIYTGVGVSAGLTTEVVRYRSVKREHIQAIEAQDPTSPTFCSIGVFQASSDSGLVLAQGSTAIPSGQVYWSGDLWLNVDEEIQARFNRSVAGDKLYLTVKTAKYPSEVTP